MNHPNEPGSSIGSTSSSLLERVKAQDQDAWRRLVRLYGPLVDGWLRRASLQVADADDVFQEVFRAVARGIGEFRRDRPPDSFRGWLKTITRTKLVDFYRRRQSSPQQLPVGFEEPVWVTNESKEGEDLRLRALEMLRADFEPRTWQMFWQVTVENRDVQDVARDFGVTPSAVRLAKSRVIRRLRDELADLERQAYGGCWPGEADPRDSR